MNDITTITTTAAATEDTTWDPTHYHVVVITHFGPFDDLDGRDLVGAHDHRSLDSAIAHARAAIEWARIDDSSTMLDCTIIACFSGHGCSLSENSKALLGLE